MANNKKTPQLEAPKKSVSAKAQNQKTSGVKRKSYEDSPENENKKTQKKVTSGSTKKERVQVFEESPRSKKLIHQIMPYLLMVLALFVIICFLLIDVFEGVSSENGVGVIGKGIRDVLCGLFGFGAFLVPIFMAILSVTWSAAVEKNCLLAKLFYAFASLVSVSTLIHVIYVSIGTPFGLGTKIDVFYKSGVTLDSGGVIGGFLGELLRTGVGLWGSVLVTLLVASLFLIFLLGLTPSYVFTLIKYRMKIRRERREAENAERRAEQERMREEEIRMREEERRLHKEALAREKEEKRAEAARKKEEAARQKEEKKRYYE